MSASTMRTFLPACEKDNARFIAVELLPSDEPGEVIMIETVEDVGRIYPRDPEQLPYITQTTLSIDDTAAMVAALQARFPTIVGPHKKDICYATTNRQEAVKAMAPKIDALLVVGAPNSSNSKRLVEVGRAAGCGYSMLVQTADDIDWRALDGARAVGITAGASAPEHLVCAVFPGGLACTRLLACADTDDNDASDRNNTQ